MAGDRPIPGMLSGEDLLAIMGKFGVEENQVRRDHVISHALAALSSIEDSRLVFFGGTALARTHLPDLRLSEDIDLIAMSPRTPLATEIQEILTSALGRTVGVLEFHPELASTRNARASVMRAGKLSIRIQLLSEEGYPRWPTEVRALEQRYADAPPARMRVLTVPAFAAAKLAAWHDRHAPRDLYDLWALAARDLISDEAKHLYSQWGPTTKASSVSFATLPTDRQWHDALAHQGPVHVDVSEAAATVIRAWAT